MTDFEEFEMTGHDFTTTIARSLKAVPVVRGLPPPKGSRADLSNAASNLRARGIRRRRLLFPAFCVCGFGEAFDRGEPTVPLGGEICHGASRFIEATGFNMVENFTPLFAPTNQSDILEDDEVFRYRLTGEWHLV